MQELSKVNHLENPTCSLCGSSKILSGASYDLSPYKVVRCSECRLWYLNPRLEELEMMKLYADDSYFGRDDKQGYSSYKTQRDSLRKTFTRFLKQLHDKGIRGNRLLEVGCGFGYMLEEAEPFFGYRAGTDFSKEAVQQASKVCDQVTLGGIDDIPGDELYDVIITVGVIEHIYEPVEFTKKLHERLKTGGKLILATPHMGSFWRLIMGTRWASFKLPEHVAFYDRNSLNKLFEKGGFSGMTQLSFPHAFPFSLVTEKLGLKVGGRLGSSSIWLPATTLAIAGEK